MKLSVHLNRKTVLNVNRVRLRNTRFVYLLLANKKHRYRYGRSAIAYIGTTKRGMGRVATSAVTRAEDILSRFGIKSVEARVVTCKKYPGVKTWVKLERAFLLVFREKYGEIPFCNSQGNRIKRGDEFEYFNRSRIEKILEALE